MKLNFQKFLRKTLEKTKFGKEFLYFNNNVFHFILN